MPASLASWDDPLNALSKKAEDAQIRLLCTAIEVRSFPMNSWTSSVPSPLVLIVSFDTIFD